MYSAYIREKTGILKFPVPHHYMIHHLHNEMIGVVEEIDMPYTISPVFEKCLTLQFHYFRVQQVGKYFFGWYQFNPFKLWQSPGNIFAMVCTADNICCIG